MWTATFWFNGLRNRSLAARLQQPSNHKWHLLCLVIFRVLAYSTNRLAALLSNLLQLQMSVTVSFTYHLSVHPCCATLSQLLLILQFYITTVYCIIKMCNVIFLATLVKCSQATFFFPVVTWFNTSCHCCFSTVRSASYLY